MQQKPLKLLCESSFVTNKGVYTEADEEQDQKDLWRCRHCFVCSQEDMKGRESVAGTGRQAAWDAVVQLSLRALGGTSLKDKLIKTGLNEDKGKTKTYKVKFSL